MSKIFLKRHGASNRLSPSPEPLRECCRINSTTFSKMRLGEIRLFDSKNTYYIVRLKESQCERWSFISKNNRLSSNRFRNLFPKKTSCSSKYIRVGYVAPTYIS